MPSTFSPALRIELIGSGEQVGVWGNTTNNNLGDLVEQAITGATEINVTAADVTLTALNGVVDQARSAVLIVTGTPGVTRVITIPNANKAYTVKNRSNATVQIKTSGGLAFDCLAGGESSVYCDGADGVTGVNNTPLNSPNFVGTPTAPTASPGTNTTQLATTAFVTGAIQATVPAGVILMWSGSIASIPAGWLLCNGASGTPDLRDRFVVGAGSTYTPGNTGGANTVTLTTAEIPSHTHSISGSGNTGDNNVGHFHGVDINSGNNNVGHTHTGSGTTSTVNVDHTHSGTTGNNNVGHVHSFSGSGSTDVQGLHSHGINDPGHSHVYVRRLGLGGGGGNDQSAGALSNVNTEAAFTGITTITNGAHSHSVSVSGTTGGISANHVHGFSTGGMSANAAHSHTFSFTTSTQSADHIHNVSGNTGAQSANHVHSFSFSGTSGPAGSGTAHENRPPYLALCYIMKT